MEDTRSIEIDINEKCSNLEEIISKYHRSDPSFDEYHSQIGKTTKLHEELADIKANRDLRDKYSFKAYKIVKKSLWGWAILLAIYALIKFVTKTQNGGQGFEIFSDTVLIAITSATTLNIFAAFLSLVKGLFPSLGRED